MKRVLVVGGGVAGAAAAHRAASRGAVVTWLGGTSGASALYSGAADLAPWPEAPSGEPLSRELLDFARALGAWSLGESPARVASPLGVVRPARARDPLVLDLEPLAGQLVVVVEPAPSPGFSLCRALRESTWAQSSRTRFRAVRCSLPSVGSSLLEGQWTQLAEGLRPEGRVAGWLLPAEYSSTEAAWDEYRAALGARVGATLGALGSVFGARLAARLQAFAPPGVERWSGRLLQLDVGANGIRARSEGRDESADFDVCVLCTGGVASGAVSLDERARLSLNFAGLEPEFEVYESDRLRRLTPSCRGGVDFSELGTHALAQIGLSLRVAPHVFAAGETRADVARTILGCAQSAIEAADEALAG